MKTTEFVLPKQRFICIKNSFFHKRKQTTFGTLLGTIPLQRLCLLFFASIGTRFCLFDQVIFPTEILYISTAMTAISIITQILYLSLPSSLFCGIHAAYDKNQLLAYKFFCHQVFKTSKVFSLLFSKNWHILKVTASK